MEKHKTPHRWEECRQESSSKCRGETRIGTHDPQHLRTNLRVADSVACSDRGIHAPDATSATTGSTTTNGCGWLLGVRRAPTAATAAAEATMVLSGGGVQGGQQTREPADDQGNVVGGLGAGLGREEILGVLEQPHTDLVDGSGHHVQLQCEHLATAQHLRIQLAHDLQGRAPRGVRALLGACGWLVSQGREDREVWGRARDGSQDLGSHVRGWLQRVVEVCQHLRHEGVPQARRQARRRAVGADGERGDGGGHKLRGLRREV
mmetsp:Transcript_60649/g.198454  ORF Transcript_60649/g.198454 Transcript_60649/m.198454 type:complete len:263 (-) Transcript_60649:690-1478(-)